MGKEAATVPALVLYDDHCGTCTANAERGRRYQRAGAIEWLGNSTPRAQALLAERGLLGKEQDSLIVIEGDRASTESTSVIRAALRLRWPWKASAALWVVPKPLRDALYRRASANRARHTECRLPSARPRA